MSTTKYVILGALGVAAVLFLRSEKSKGMRDAIADQAKKLKDELKKKRLAAINTVDDLRGALGTEIEGLTKDARKRIEHVLDGHAPALKN